MAAKKPMPKGKKSVSVAIVMPMKGKKGKKGC